MNNQTNDVSVEIWKSGKPMQDVFWSEEMAEACVFLMDNINLQYTIIINPENTEIREKYKAINNTHILIGTGK